jgi:NADPH:quinone reductase-like Zn-dependent oxidoreductase
MKAIVYSNYGGTEKLQLKEVEKPKVSDNEVLVKVHAASVNSWDWDRLTGKPYFYRLLSGLRKPKLKILGADIAGQIESFGKNVTGFRPGDKVLSDLCQYKWGGFAEYVCVPAGLLTRMPESMTFQEAAAIPQAAVLALQGLQDIKPVQAGQKVLINGAGGGVGTFAVQMAKTFGAEVTGADSQDKLEMIHSLGADHVMDYSTENYVRTGRTYDLIIDVVARQSVFAYKRALKPGGVFVAIGGMVPTILGILFFGPVLSLFGNKKLSILAHSPNKNMDNILKLFEDGNIKSVIDKCFPLNKTAEALDYIGNGRVKGKIVITPLFFSC